MKQSRLIAVLILSVCGIFAQSFDVATIKPTPPEWNSGRYFRMETAHQFIARNHALKTLIAGAYNLTPRAILGGPAWVDSDHYDILAETPGEARPSLDQQMSMLRNLLVDRFQLTFHREQREFSIYTLTVAKTGSKLKDSVPSPDASPAGPPPLIFHVGPQGLQLPGQKRFHGRIGLPSSERAAPSTAPSSTKPAFPADTISISSLRPTTVNSTGPSPKCRGTRNAPSQAFLQLYRSSWG